MLRIILQKRFASDMIDGVLVFLGRLLKVLLKVFPSGQELIES